MAAKRPPVEKDRQVVGAMGVMAVEQELMAVVLEGAVEAEEVEVVAAEAVAAEVDSNL